MAALERLATPLAHGNNLDEIGIAFAVLVGIALLVALAWLGGRRHDPEKEPDDEQGAEEP